MKLSLSLINVEIKAECLDSERIRKILRSRDAEFKGMDHQIDTYFKVHSGRLKLREGNIENYLIFYHRKNQKGPKQSNVMLFNTEPNSALKSILAESLGILVIVEKRREIYFIENVKFHIDDVKNLGSFLEIEAIGTQELVYKAKLHEQCEFYKNLFKIQDEDLISDSYSDLLLKKKTNKFS